MRPSLPSWTTENPYYLSLYWLFNRDSYTGILKNQPYNKGEYNPQQDGAPKLLYVDLSLQLYPFITMVFHRVCWGSNYLITTGGPFL